MSKRRPIPHKSSVLSPTPDYWAHFLESQNLIGHVSRQMEEGAQEVSKTSAPIEPIIISPDQWTFIFRVAEALVPVSGYPADIKKQLLKTREMYRIGLEKVFREQTEFEAWFTDVRQKTGLKEVELMEIMRDALEGLHSEDAKQLRETFGKGAERIKMARAGMLGV